MKTNAILTFLILAAAASQVSAYADSYLVIDNKGSSLCLSVDGLDTPKCGNESVQLDGTADHTVYIMPQSEINIDSTNTEKFTYFFTTPLTLLAGGAGFLIVMMMFTISLFYVLTNMRKRKMGG